MPQSGMARRSRFTCQVQELCAGPRSSEKKASAIKDFWCRVRVRDWGWLALHCLSGTGTCSFITQQVLTEHLALLRLCACQVLPPGPPNGGGMNG